MKLAASDHFTWLALRRVNCATVTRREDRYYYDGDHLIPGCLYEYLFTVLIDVGLLDIADPDDDGMARVTLSDDGRTEYRALCKQQRQPAR